MDSERGSILDVVSVYLLLEVPQEKERLERVELLVLEEKRTVSIQPRDLSINNSLKIQNCSKTNLSVLVDGRLHILRVSDVIEDNVVVRVLELKQLSPTLPLTGLS